MKRSEFLERIRTGKHPTDKHETVFEYFARESVIAAEAAGVAWDPEEETVSVPESLIFFRGLISPGCINPEDGTATVDIWSYPPARYQEAAFREAVRRYNAWPELLRLLDDMERGDWTAGKPIARLHAILRGS